MIVESEADTDFIPKLGSTLTVFAVSAVYSGVGLGDGLAREPIPVAVHMVSVAWLP